MSRSLFGSRHTASAPIQFTEVTQEAAAKLREGGQTVQAVVWLLQHTAFPFQEVPVWWEAPPSTGAEGDVALGLVQATGLLAFVSTLEREHGRSFAVETPVTLARVTTMEAVGTRTRTRSWRSAWRRSRAPVTGRTCALSGRARPRAARPARRRRPVRLWTRRLGQARRCSMRAPPRGETWPSTCCWASPSSGWRVSRPVAGVSARLGACPPACGCLPLPPFPAPHPTPRPTQRSRCPWQQWGRRCGCTTRSQTSGCR